MNKKKLIIWAIILIALAFLVWICCGSKKKKTETLLVEEQAPDPFPLKYGSRGKEVKQAQMAAKLKLLREEGINNSFPKYGCDGVWGDETTEYIQKAFKRDNISKAFYDKTLMGNLNPSAF